MESIDPWVWEGNSEWGRGDQEEETGAENLLELLTPGLKTPINAKQRKKESHG
jgi:hypothetical protein